MYKVTIALALLLATAMAMPQLGGHRPLVGGFGQFPAFGGTGSGAGAGTGNAGPGGVSASGVGISSASNGGLATGTGTCSEPSV
uniref:Uncharacterized protein n=1 Tax=Daphnia magna TaxID=35525 RepID=A0A0P5J074_9CRUS